MKIITSLSNNYIKKISKLRIKKYRDQQKMFIIEGYHSIYEAKKANCLKQVLIVDKKEQIQNVENILVTREIILKLSQTKNPQNIIGICEITEGEEIVGNRILLLDDVRDPGNLGTIIRSALGFYIDQIIISDNCVDLYNDKVIRSTQGAIFKIPIMRKNLIEAISILKERNLYIIGTALKNAVPLESIGKINKYAIILGNEANGIKKEILNITDTNVKITTNEKLESLNVAIAGSIIMHYLGVGCD